MLRYLPERTRHRAVPGTALCRKLPLFSCFTAILAVAISGTVFDDLPLHLCASMRLIATRAFSNPEKVAEPQLASDLFFSSRSLYYTTAG